MICQRILENKTLDLKTIFDQARSLESAMKSCESYTASTPPVNITVPHTTPLLTDDEETKMLAATAESSGCYFCAN